MLKKILLFIFIYLFTGVPVKAQVVDNSADLKAAFIYNFTKYIDWDLANPDFTIGVIGSSSIYQSLVEIAKTRTVNDKKIVVRHFNKPEDITNCNILFISSNTDASLSSINAKINKGTLTISEENGFAELGTCFNFVVRNDKLRFEANIKSLNAAGLKASSQLLKLAILVD